MLPKSLKNRIRRWRVDFYQIALLIITSVTHHVWWNPFAILFYGDWRHRNDDAVQQLTNFGRGTWINFYNFGEHNIQLYNFPFNYLWGIIGNYALAVRVTMLWPIALLSVLAPYYLLLHLKFTHQLAFLGSLVYAFNTYIIIKSGAHLNIAMVYVLAPLLMLFLIRLLESPSLKRVLLFSLLFVIGCNYELRMMYILCFVFLIITLFYTNKDGWSATIKSLLSVGGFVFLLNIYWLLPTFLSSNHLIGEIANRGLWGDDLFTLIRSLSLSDWHWTGGAPVQDFVAQPVPVYLWLTPLLATLGFFEAKRKPSSRRILLVFMSTWLVGILLAKQSSPPLPQLYLWLYEHFPGFRLFRLADKFYLLLAIGVMGLLPAGVNYLFSLVQNSIFRTAIFIGVSTTLLIPTVSLVSQEHGTLFVTQTEPAQYKALTEKLSSDDAFFRTLWIPLYSQWGYFDMTRPKISQWQVMHKLFGNHDYWASYSTTSSGVSQFTNPKHYSSVLSQELGQPLLNASSVKYVIIPSELDQRVDRIFPYAGERASYVELIDDIPYLEKIESGLLDVYVNKSALPNIYALDSVFHLPNEADLSTINSIATRTGPTAALATVSEKKTADRSFFSSKTDLSSLTKSYQDATLSIDLSSLSLSEKRSSLVIDNQLLDLLAYREGGELVITSSPFHSLSVPDNALAAFSPATTPVSGAPSFTTSFPERVYIGIDNKLTRLAEGKTSLGFQPQEASLTIYQKTERSLVQNGSFEQGLWTEEVGNCQEYDDNPIIAMSLNRESASDGVASLQLESQRHMACTIQDISIDENQAYEISLDYKTSNAQTIRYVLLFNDNTKTTIDRRMPPDRYDEWVSYTGDFFAPEGSDSVRLYLYSVPSETEEENIITLIDNVHMHPLEKAGEYNLPRIEERFSFLPLTILSKQEHLNISNDYYPYRNLLRNNSFEDGPWNKEVGNCRNYDEKPAIGQSINLQHSTDGYQSLQLDATRHYACNSQPVHIQGGQSYFFSMEYMSPTRSTAGFYIGFNDPENTSYSQRLNADAAWETLDLLLSAPEEATLATIFIYAYESDKETLNTVLYDNLRFVETPPVVGRYFIQEEPEQSFFMPTQVDYEIKNPSMKTIAISGASTPFFLAMSDSFHPDWRVSIDNKKVNGFLNSWLPFIRPDSIPKDYHFELNGFLNAWYIDVDKYCEVENHCTRNQNGTYDFDLVVEFVPQRWFYLGLLISGTTLLGILGYLLWPYRGRVGLAWLSLNGLPNVRFPLLPRERPPRKTVHHHRLPSFPPTTKTPSTTINDLDLTLVEKTRHNIEEHFGYDAANLEALLRELGCLTKAGQPTLSGLLLFGKTPQKHHKGATLSIVHYDKNLDILNRHDLAGNLIVLIEESYARLQEILPRRQTFSAQSGKRVSTPILPTVTIREALMNAISHRDYDQQSSRIIISVYDDRVEFQNPGGLPNGITPKTIHKSQYSRNPVIADVLNALGYVEQLGSGIDRIYKAVSKAGLRRPKVEDLGNQVVFTLYFS